MLASAKFIASDLTTIFIAGAGVRIGTAYSSFINGVYRNPSLQG
jgi:F0F1-type ATP synthase membrane subunit c/vacuolar-type H+-ATPase subunit K